MTGLRETYDCGFKTAVLIIAWVLILAGIYWFLNSLNASEAAAREASARLEYTQALEHVCRGIEGGIPVRLPDGAVHCKAAGQCAWIRGVP